jgi:hypothetical protein
MSSARVTGGMEKNMLGESVGENRRFVERCAAPDEPTP